MPFFKWIGTSENMLYKGKLFARSLEHACQKIQQQGIAIIIVHSYHPLVHTKVSLKEKSMFMHQLSDLLAAGIRLSDALTIARSSIKNDYFLLHIDDCIQAVIQGVPFYQACSFYIHLFDPLERALLQAGHETGDLVGVTKRITEYLQAQQLFKERMRSALIMPCITGLFFIGVSLFIFMVIVPRFETLLSASQAPLPPLTRAVLTLSHVICSLMTFKNSLLFLFAIIVTVLLFTKTRLKCLWDRVSLSIPFFGTLLYEKTLSKFLMVTGILVEERVPLLSAVQQAQQTVHNDLLKSTFKNIQEEVKAGKSLSVAFAAQPLLRNQQIESLLRVGEATATLGKLLLQGAQLFQKNVEKKLEAITTFIQPIVLIILGLLIGTLIIAVYVPLLSLTSSIGTTF